MAEQRAPADGWPDPLHHPTASQIQDLLASFWHELEPLADLANRRELLLLHELTNTLRGIVLQLMLALNGIGRPAGTRHLNGYLGASQREAIERTLLFPAREVDAATGQAVALVVIYRWYAPQLVDRFGLVYPTATEERVLAHLHAHLGDWPASITTPSKPAA